MKIQKLTWLGALFLMPVVLLANTETVDLNDPASVITWLMPVITLAVTWGIKQITPLITGWVTLIVVPLISGGIAYIATVLDSDAGFWIQFLAGLGSVFLNQLYRQLTGNSK